MNLLETIKVLDNIPHKHLSFNKKDNKYIIYFEPKEKIEIDFATKINNLYKIEVDIYE